MIFKKQLTLAVTVVILNVLSHSLLLLSRESKSRHRRRPLPRLNTSCCLLNQVTKSPFLNPVEESAKVKLPIYPRRH